jgi:hypothetical protein
MVSVIKLSGTPFSPSGATFLLLQKRPKTAIFRTVFDQGALL